MRSTVLTLAVLAAATPFSASGQAPERPQILVLGTYHMGSAGSHVYESRPDDVLAEARQAELEELTDLLARFRPTKIAVEASVTSDRVSRAYAAFLAGERELGRNEIDQIAFRLAKKLGHETVHPVDEDGDFPFYRVQNYAIANDMQAEWDSLMAEGRARTEALGRFREEHTIPQILAHMNADSTVAEDVGGYYGYVAFGQPYEYAGPDLLAAWYRRNIHIYHNIRALADSPDDRILVVYGAGHLGWLQRMVRDDPGVELVKLAEVVEGK